MKYEGFAVSERGYQHILNETVCQDSVQYVQDLKCAVAAVADGHGSSQYFRSDRGSHFAAEISCNKMREFLHSDVFSESNVKIESIVVTQLIHSIITDWHIAVRNDLIKCPLTRDEIQKVPEKYLAEYSVFCEENVHSYTEVDLRKKVQSEQTHIQKAYGTTLITVGVCETYAIGLHIGDGKCVALYEDGTMDEPIPWDGNCHLNLCTSLCDRNAAEEFRYYIWKEKLPVAIFIGTDGIDDTFAAKLHPFYRTMALDFLQQDFRNSVHVLQSKLIDISRIGSRDDVSIGGIIHVSKMRKMETKLKLIAALESAVFQKHHLQENESELQFRIEKLQRMYIQYRTKADDHDTEFHKKTIEYESKIEAAETERTTNQEKQRETEKLIQKLQAELEAIILESENEIETSTKSELLILENEEWKEDGID